MRVSNKMILHAFYIILDRVMLSYLLLLCYAFNIVLYCIILYLKCNISIFSVGTAQPIL